jgi:hypothetical protein
MTQTRYVFTLLALLLVAGGGVGVGVGEIRRNATSRRIYDSLSFHTFSATQQIRRAPHLLDAMTVTGHGGLAEIEWYYGPWSSLSNRGSSTVSLYRNGHRLATTVLSGTGGRLNARQGILRWIGRLPPGKQSVAVRLDAASSVTAIPLVLSNTSVVEDIEVTEHAG